MAKRKPANDQRTRTGPVKGDFIAPPEVADADERADALRAQEEFSKPATRFGSMLEEPDRINKIDKMAGRQNHYLVNPVNPVKNGHFNDHRRIDGEGDRRRVCRAQRPGRGVPGESL
jgi:hypothetical protein